MKKVETTTVEELQSEYPRMIEGAKRAVDYFKSMEQAHKAIGEVVKSQIEYAENELKKLEDEYERKFQSASVSQESEAI